MPTDAVNRNILSPDSYRSYPSWTSGSTYANPYGALDMEQRPASVSIPFENGIRKCGSWNHIGSKWRKGSGSLWLGDPSANNVKYVGCIEDGNFPVAPSSPSSLQNRSLTKALENLKDQKVHLGTFIAEGRKTVNMITQNATSIARSIRNFRRKFPELWLEVTRRQAFPKRNRRKCDIPGKWLEVQYGWTPLLSDIFGAVQHLKKGRRRPLVTVSSSVEDESVEYRISNLLGYVTIRRPLKVKHVVRTFLHYGLESDPLAELSSVGLINPAEIAWELLPYSFVVDWFLPVGPWISALTADVGFSFITGGQSRKTTMVPLGSPTVLSQVPGILSLSLPGFTGKSERFVRHCYSQSPVPGLYVKNPLSTLHVLNAIALISQAFQRR